MMRLLRRLWPDSVVAQVALLMFGAITFFQFVVTSTYIFNEPEWRLAMVEPGEAVASGFVALDAAEPANRQQVIDQLAAATPWIRYRVLDTSPARSRIAPPDSPFAFLRERLWPDAVIRIPTVPTGSVGGDVAVSLRKGGYAVAALLEERRSSMAEAAKYGEGARRFFTLRNLQRSATLFLLCALVAALWLSFVIIGPLTRIAHQAEQFGTHVRAPPAMEETGPRELRELSRALNRMQARIQSMVESRSRALAAISHDLRTIITRIRLRSEFIADDALKAKMLQDAGTMDAMLQKNLLYLRGEETDPDRSLIDLDSVLQTIADEFVDQGHSVAYEGGGRQTVYGSLDELQRLFSNLVENGVNYAGKVTISVSSPDRGAIVVDVADEGPGIAAEKEKLLEPFVRGQPARNMNDKIGFGLGLSIVQSLVEKAGGKFALIDRKPHGLIARVTLPAAFPNPV